MTKTDIKSLQSQYWKKLTSELIDNYPQFKPRRPDRNAYYLPLGRKFAHISMKINSQKNIQECKIVMTNKGLFDYLKEYQEQIEYDFGFPLDWDKKTGVESHITISNEFNIRNEDEWDVAIKWHLDNASKLHLIFSALIDKY